MNAKEGALIAGNWKDKNMTIAQALAWADAFNGFRPTSLLRPNLQLVLFPPATAIYPLRQRLLNLEHTKTMLEQGALAIGTQESSPAEGEKVRVSGSLHPNLLIDPEIGASYALLGHSERRLHFKETDELIAKRLGLAMKYGLKPVLCVGETLNERELGTAKDVVKRQLGILDALSPEIRQTMTIAYEPVWAIGTGKNADPSDANDMCGFVREVSRAKRVIYGGSVTSDKAAEFFKQPEIDGALPGGASEKANEFFGIAQAASNLL